VISIMAGCVLGKGKRPPDRRRCIQANSPRAIHSIKRFWREQIESAARRLRAIGRSSAVSVFFCTPARRKIDGNPLRGPANA